MSSAQPSCALSSLPLGPSDEVLLIRLDKSYSEDALKDDLQWTQHRAYRFLETLREAEPSGEEGSDDEALNFPPKKARLIYERRKLDMEYLERTHMGRLETLDTQPGDVLISRAALDDAQLRAARPWHYAEYDPADLSTFEHYDMVLSRHPELPEHLVQTFGTLQIVRRLAFDLRAGLTPGAGTGTLSERLGALRRLTAATSAALSADEAAHRARMAEYGESDEDEAGDEP